MTFDIMTLVTFVFIYILVWWIVIFCVLPWGAQAPEKQQIGFANSAPANPRMGFKLLLTTIISLVVTGMIYAIAHYMGFSVLGLITMQEM